MLCLASKMCINNTEFVQFESPINIEKHQSHHHVIICHVIICHTLTKPDLTELAYSRYECASVVKAPVSYSRVLFKPQHHGEDIK